MSTVRSRLLAVSLTAMWVGCATLSASGPTEGSSSNDEPSSTKPSGGKSSSAKSTSSELAAGQPPINARAKLLFDDAVKGWDAQKKAKTVDYPKLERMFRAAADADSALAEATYNLGVLAERQGRVRDAVGYYKEALDKKPTLHQAAENLAVIAQNEGDERGAVAIYEELSATFPDDASSRARLAEIHRRRGANDQAIELAKAALFRDPKTLQAYKTMMLVHLEQKQYSLARLIALRASKLDDSDPELFHALGLINLAEKEPAKARVQFKKAVEVRPGFLPAHYELVRMAFAQEDYQSAEEHLRRILQANGKDAQALLNLGVAYKGMGQIDKAMAMYDEAQRLDPEMPQLSLNKGIIIALKGDPEQAISMFKNYLARRGGEGAVAGEHPIFALIEEQEKAVKQREDEKRMMEEAKRMEEEAKKQEAAAEAEARKKKDEELQKQQSAAKGKGGKVAAPSPDAPAPRKDEATPKAEPKREEPSPKAEPKKGGSPKSSSDEPEEVL